MAFGLDKIKQWGLARIKQTDGVPTLVGGGMTLSTVEVTPYVNATSTQTAFSGPCELAGYDCTVAAGNITIYDGTSASGIVIVPTTALTVGRFPFPWKIALTAGCHVVLSGAATVNIMVG